MQTERRDLILKRMMADHETSFGPDQWRDARAYPSKDAVDAIVRSLNCWDDRLQEYTHSEEVYLNQQFRDAVCERLGCSYETLTEDLPDTPDPGWTFMKVWFIGLGLLFLAQVIRFIAGRL